jgi:cell division protease FtsH
MRLWWLAALALLIFNAIFYYSQLGMNPSGQGAQLTVLYSTFVAQVRADQVATARITDATIAGDYKKPYHDPASGRYYVHYTTTVGTQVLNTVVSLLDKHRVQVSFASQGTPVWLTVLGLLIQALPFLLLIALFYFGSRAARHQQQGLFGFGRSRAKLYTMERPSPTFADVAAWTLPRMSFERSSTSCVILPSITGWERASPRECC